MSSEPTPVEQIPRARRDNPADVPIVLSDGRTWRLARPGVAPVLAEVRDRIYDDVTYRKRASMVDVLQAAWVMLVANYELADGEIERLLTGVDDGRLVAAVLDSLFGHTNPNRTYSEWVLSAFHANGIDPAKVPPALIPEVMTQLVGTGRALPEDKFITSAKMAGKRKRIIGGPS